MHINNTYKSNNKSCIYIFIIKKNNYRKMLK